MKEIQYKDIQKGDTIRATKTFHGVVVTREAVMAVYTASSWYTKEGGFFGSETDDTYYLVDRPTPPLPTAPGTVFRATEIRGVKMDAVIMVRETSGRYGPLYFSSLIVDACDVHEAKHITAWEPIEGNKNNG